MLRGNMVSSTYPLLLGFCDFSAFSGSSADYLLNETLAASASAFFNDCQNCGALMTVVITPLVEEVNADLITLSFDEPSSKSCSTARANSFVSTIDAPSAETPEADCPGKKMGCSSLRND